MKLQFDLANVIHLEFGIGQDGPHHNNYAFVPVDKGVKEVLHEMVRATWDTLSELSTNPPRYEPSEKYQSEEYLYLPLDHELSVPLQLLHQAINLDTTTSALKFPNQIFCYFARLTDGKDRKLTALRRATQFKGILKNRLIRFFDDTLKIIEDRVFKLDTDFDLLIDDATIHILRPSGFEFVGQLQEAVLSAVPHNIKQLKNDLTFVEFASIESYAAKHPRAARYLASIRGQKETKDIDKGNLKRLCKMTGVEINESKGKFRVEENHVLGFLEVLDRRRYEIELIKNQPESYRAASRKLLGR